MFETPPVFRIQPRVEKPQLKYWMLGAFAVLALFFVVPGVRAIGDYRGSLAAYGRIGSLTAAQLDELMPKQVGDYQLNRAWQQRVGNTAAVESAVYVAAGMNEIILGVWLLPTHHSIHDSWSIRGEDPEMRASRDFLTAQGRIVSFDTAYYSDGITDTLAGNALCTPLTCALVHNENGMHLNFLSSLDSSVPGRREVPIYFRIEVPHGEKPKDAIYKALTAEAQRFLEGVDLPEVSRKFQ
jgi:hypothetical protein